MSANDEEDADAGCDESNEMWCEQQHVLRHTALRLPDKNSPGNVTLGGYRFSPEQK